MSVERIALVTGASRGLGRAAALALAADGWRVVCLARSQKALEQLDDEVKSAGAGSLVLVPLDLKDFDAIDRLGAALYERFGKLDALVSCAAALGALTPSFQAAPRVMEEVMNVNVHAAQRLIRAMHPLLRAADAGRAAFTTCEAAHNARAYWGPYAASKAALEALVQAYAAECVITAIKANLFDPGTMSTALRAKAFPGEEPNAHAAPETIAPKLVALVQPGFAENGARIAAQ
jgi:NAD(P)-dependent dehydrogenase (short-subunit alcohol dehydrogenase family)